MRVSADFICEHGMPRPWGTCTECMALSVLDRPEPPYVPPIVPRRVSRRRPLPEAATDVIPKLVGDKDLSLPVSDVEAHMEGNDNDWIFPAGGFPNNLRAGGWIYLRMNGRLEARVRVRGIGFRAERVQHTGPPEGQGPGPTIEVDSSTWQRVSIDLGSLAKSQRQGYRYLITADDDSITHLAYTAPIPAGIRVDPPFNGHPTPSAA